MEDGQFDFASMIEGMNLPADQIQNYLMGLQQQHLMQSMLANMPAAAFQQGGEGGGGGGDGGDEAAAANMAQMAQMMGFWPGMAQQGGMEAMYNLLGHLQGGGGGGMQAAAAAAANQVRAARLAVSYNLIMQEM